MWVAFAKATHIFSAKNIRILYIESTKTVNEMTLNELVKLTTLWTTGPRILGHLPYLVQAVHCVQCVCNWTSTWQNLQYDLRNQRRLRSACAFAESDLSLCWLHLPSTPSSYLKRNKQKPWPYWMDLQAALSLAGHTGLIVVFVMCWFIWCHYVGCIMQNHVFRPM